VTTLSMNTQEPIAIVGMAGLFPDAFSLEVFWKMIAQRKTAIGKVQPGRWPVPEASMLAPGLTPDRAYSANCGLIEGFRFDPHDIDLPGLPVDELDPLHHITLHVGREAIESLRTAKLPKTRTRVI